jgi:hypothetical protein
MGVAQGVQLREGLVITKTTRVIGAGRVYRLPNADDLGKSAAIVIRGNGITVDFQGAVMQGTPTNTPPDRRKGTAVIVEGKNVTIRNLVARGYKLGLVARDCPGIKVLDCDFSYNWKQRLLSTLDREDGADWMSFHRNEKDEWLRYGCGVYLRNCDDFELRGVTVRGGQSGVYLMECDRGLVWNCDLSFLSAVGLAMYLSSDNRIMHNNIDWCVRGYSHGKWNRGQDSAGIIIYEQSNRNVFAYNSVTHGGDGFFLWAGQTTMDTGKGGCNDNLVYGNDFSHAPTNGIEATFSRNKFINNLVMECWHGVWGGFSWESEIAGNVFAYNAEGIALEHGQDNSYRNNIFYRDTTALAIWQNERIDPNWGYGKVRDCRSRDQIAAANLFSNIPGVVANVRSTENFRFVANKLVDCARLLAPPNEDRKTFAFGNNYLDGVGLDGAQQVKWVSSVATRRAPNPLPPTMLPSGNVIQEYTDDYSSRFRTNWNPFRTDPRPITIGMHPSGRNLIAQPQQGATSPRLEEALRLAPKPLQGGKRPFLSPGALRGRRYILVDEWGPYDFLSPKLWPRGEVAESLDEAGRIPPSARKVYQRLDVLGPKGTAKVVRSRGCKAEGYSIDGGRTWKDRPSSGAYPVPCMIRIAYDQTGSIDRQVEMEYIGAKVVSPWGEVTPAGKPYRFSYTEFFAPIDWHIAWFEYDRTTQEPREHYSAFQDLLKGRPVKTARSDRLDFAGDVPGVRGDYFATVANGTLSIAPGEYVIEVTADDGVRVWLDDKMVLDEWHWQGPTMYPIRAKLGGVHKLRVEHFEIDGYSMLKVNVRRA